MMNDQRNGSALILALLMTTVIVSCTFYVWHMASFASRLARTCVVAHSHEQAVQGLLRYAIALAKESYPVLLSPTQEFTKDTKFTLARFPITHDHFVHGQVLIEGHKEYLRIVATLVENGKIYGRASCSLREGEAKQGTSPKHIIDGYSIHGA